MKLPPELCDAPEERVGRRRLYMTGEERRAFLTAADAAPGPLRTLCYVLAYTGCKPREALSVTAAHVDLATRAISFESLPRRRKAITRTVPVPAHVIDDLDRVHAIRSAQDAPDRGLSVPLWRWSRHTARNRVNRVIELSGIQPGPHATARGLRHAYAVTALANGIPLDLLQKWLGYADIYKAGRAYGQDPSRSPCRQDHTRLQEYELASRMWDHF